MHSLSSEGQQDDHCRLTFMGQNWWIAGVRGHIIALTNETGQTLLDVSGVDWPSYWMNAEAMMRDATTDLPLPEPDPYPTVADLILETPIKSEDLPKRHAARVAQEQVAYDTTYFDESTVRTAMSGACASVAVALHRRTGWPIGAVWFIPMIDAFTIFPDPVPVHVFVVAPDGRAVDVEGARTSSEMAERYRQQSRLGRMVSSTHGDEVVWRQMAFEAGHPALAPSDYAVAAADKTLRTSEAFSRLIDALAEAGAHPPGP